MLVLERRGGERQPDWVVAPALDSAENPLGLGLGQLLHDLVQALARGHGTRVRPGGHTALGAHSVTAAVVRIVASRRLVDDAPAPGTCRPERLAERVPGNAAVASANDTSAPEGHRLQATTVELLALFDRDIRYVVPIFQRNHRWE